MIGSALCTTPCRFMPIIGIPGPTVAEPVSVRFPDIVDAAGHRLTGSFIRRGSCGVACRIRVMGWAGTAFGGNAWAAEKVIFAGWRV